MKKSFYLSITVLVIPILCCAIFYGFYYGTTAITHPYSRTGEYYSKNVFNVFYEVRAGRGCDNCSAYDKKRRIVGADPKTFEVLNRHYSMDKNNFYVCAWTGPDLFRITTKCETLENIDRSSFFSINDENGDKYAKDRNHIYFLGSAIENADPESFRIVDYNYAVDRGHIYYRDTDNRLYVVKEVKTSADIAEFFKKERKDSEEKIRSMPIVPMKDFFGIID